MPRPLPIAGPPDHTTTRKPQARSPQVSVFACDQTPIQSAIHQPKELGARRSLSLLPPKRSHNTMKACNQCNQRMSMQRHHTCSCRAYQQQRARSLGQRSLSQLSASSEPRKVSVYACCKKWCHPQKHSPNRMASHQRCHHACHQHQPHYTTRHLHQAAPIDGCFRIGQRRLHGWPEGLIDPPSRNHHRAKVGACKP